MTRVLLILVLMVPQFACASEFYIGLNIGNRLGWILGYRVDAEHSVEAHFVGVPHNISYGLALKRYRSPTSNEYMIASYSGFNKNHPMDPNGVTDVKAFSLGLGYSYRKTSSKWTYPVELGASIYHKSDVGKWRPHPYFGVAALYGEAQ